MSHGPPPHQEVSLYGFGALGGMAAALGPDLAAANLAAADGQDANDMMALLDNAMFDPFDSISMSIDNDDVAPEQFQHVDLGGAGDPQTIHLFSKENFAGPLVSGVQVASVFTPQSSAGGPGSTVTEFTKRRNWPAKVVEELKDLLQILDADGRIKYVSPSVKSLTGFASEDLLDTLLSDLIHPDDVGVWVSEFNESIAKASTLRIFYRLRTKDGSYVIFESVGHGHIAGAEFAPNPHNQSPFCQAVFMMSRPYPMRNASLLDSFLESKMENERLRRRIAELREEEEAEEESQRQWLQGLEGRSDFAPSEDTTALSIAAGGQATAAAAAAAAAVVTATVIGSSGTGAGAGTIDPLMPPPELPGGLNAALTRENLEGQVAGSRPDSLRDKMARFEAAASPANTIEMLTGLRYVEGERSRGITTGSASPALIRGDAGIPIPPERDPRSSEKSKKKQKTCDEYVCTDCGTLDSPEWRRGPSGPKTLCNACGLRWAKKEKKRANSIPSGNNGKSLPMVDPGTG